MNKVFNKLEKVTTFQNKHHKIFFSKIQKYHKIMDRFLTLSSVQKVQICRIKQ